MAPKKLVEDPPPASSSEEEVESGEEEEDEEVESGEEEGEEAGGKGEEDEDDDEDEEDEEESDDQEVIPKKPQVVSKHESPSSSGEDEEEEEEEDSDEEEGSGEDVSDSDGIPEKSKPTEAVRSSSTKPSVADEAKPKKTVSKPSASSAPAISVTPISQKRPAAESDKDDSDSKKKKKIDEENGGGSSSQPGGEKDPKKLFARVWSDDDEVVILKGMLVWHEKGDDPFADLGGFLDSIKESVHATVNKDQLLNKMRRLKKKYQNNFKRGKGGLDPIFSKPHDLKCYELMKVIWGGEEVSRKRSAPAAADNGNDESHATNGKKSRSSKPKPTPVSPKQKTAALSDISSKVPKEEIQDGNLAGYPILAAAFREGKNLPIVGESLLKEGLALLGDSKVKEMENQWIKVHEAEAEVYLKRVDLIREQTAIVLDAVKSSNS